MAREAKRPWVSTLPLPSIPGGMVVGKGGFVEASMCCVEECRWLTDGGNWQPPGQVPCSGAKGSTADKPGWGWSGRYAQTSESTNTIKT